MNKRLLILTGAPGVGKTTVLSKVVESLKAKGYRVGGMVSREVRSCGTRVGFEVLGLNTSKHGWLAHVNHEDGPRVGKYRVNVKDLNNVGVEAIVKAVESMDIIVIDEIGPMELFSEEFRNAVKMAVESRKLVVSIVHWKAKDKLVDELETRNDAEIYVITHENREHIYCSVVEGATKFLEST